MHEKLRELDEAIMCYQKALKREKDNFLANYRLGCALIKVNRREEGIECLNKAYKIDPDDLNTLVRLGEIYAKEDSKLREAETMLKKALTQDEEIPEAHMTLGRIYEKYGRNDEAIEYFKKGIKLSLAQNFQRGTLQGNFYLGCQYEKKKELKQAIYHFKQVLLHDQSHFGACIHLATQLANLGEFSKAEKYFKHCVKLDYTSVPAHFGLGKVLLHFEKNGPAFE